MFRGFTSLISLFSRTKSKNQTIFSIKKTNKFLVITMLKSFFFVWFYTLSRKKYDDLVRILVNNRHEEFWYGRDINKDKAKEAMTDDDAFLEILCSINKRLKGKTDIVNVIKIINCTKILFLAFLFIWPNIYFFSETSWINLNMIS